jgi:hypothetical protein
VTVDKDFLPNQKFPLLNFSRRLEFSSDFTAYITISSPRESFLEEQSSPFNSIFVFDASTLECAVKKEIDINISSFVIISPSGRT